MAEGRKPTKAALRIDFLSLGGSLAEYDPKWTRAALEQRVEELRREADAKPQAKSAIPGTLFDPTPPRVPTVVERVFVRGFEWLLIGLAVFSVIAGVIFWYDWLSEKSPWELLGGLGFLVLIVWFYRHAMSSVGKR